MSTLSVFVSELTKSNVVIDNVTTTNNNEVITDNDNTNIYCIIKSTYSGDWESNDFRV